MPEDADNMAQLAHPVHPSHLRPYRAAPPSPGASTSQALFAVIGNREWRGAEPGVTSGVVRGLTYNYSTPNVV